MILVAWQDHTKSLGRFNKDKTGIVSFGYNYQYSGPLLSVSLPIEPSDHATDVTSNFLENLLPDCKHARSQVAHACGIDPEDSFGLLDIIGRECPGSLILMVIGQQPAEIRKHPRQLPDMALSQWRQMLGERPLMTGSQGMPFYCLAGKTPKTVLHFKEKDQVYLPEPWLPSTHIVKATRSGQDPSSIYADWFCMQLARRLLGEEAVATNDLWKKCLRVCRFDRYFRDGIVNRIHQEDLCQALGLPPSGRYELLEAVDDPSDTLLARVFRLFDELGRSGWMVPVVQKRAFFRQLLTRVLLLDGALHLKKFSLIHRHDGNIELAPLYGLRTIQPTQTPAGDADTPDKDTARNNSPQPDLQLAIGRATTIAAITEADCIECATSQLGFSERYARNEYRELRTQLVKTLDFIALSTIRIEPAAEPTIRRTADLLKAQHA
jgi:serine/threonine-protein kinase HipA